MASILSPLSNKKVTPKFLKELGFDNISWGSPVKVTIIREKGKTKRKLDFAESQYCWEWFDDNKQLDDYYKTLIYYFPNGFDEYVSPFQGDWRDPLHPANYALVTIDNTSDKWYERILIETEDDIELLFALAKQRISYLNKKFFSIE